VPRTPLGGAYNALPGTLAGFGDRFTAWRESGRGREGKRDGGKGQRAKWGTWICH